MNDMWKLPDPIRLVRMVNEIGRLNRLIARHLGPHPARPDGERDSQAAARRDSTSQPIFFTHETSSWGSIRGWQRRTSCVIFFTIQTSWMGFVDPGAAGAPGYVGRSWLVGHSWLT